MAQTIKTPQFPTPEKGFYSLLQEEKVTNPLALAGKVKQVTKIFNAYKNGEVETSERELNIIDEDGNISESYLFFENEKFDNYSPKPKQETDSIEGFERINVITDNDETFEYWYKDNKLMRQIMLEEMYFESEQKHYKWEEVYTYDSEGRLATRHIYDYDYIIEEEDDYVWSSKAFKESELATYKDGLIIDKKMYFYLEDVVYIYDIVYSYDNQKQLKNYTVKYQGYSAENLDFEKSLEVQNYSDAKKSKNTSKAFVGSFEYDTDNRLIRFNLKDLILNNITESYEVSYPENQMLVNAAINKFETQVDGNTSKTELKLQYDYTFDQYKNPIDIKSYYWLGDKKVLDKETTLEIVYHQ
ncbi:MAG: hypothetical protein EVB11_13005 [Winogradskyella sp.]|nr:MAG: hypothetical protein EVB11_13005 [Winogradskyella sp.]